MKSTQQSFVKITEDPWNHGFFPSQIKHPGLRQIQFTILRLKSNHLHMFKEMPNVLYMPVDDVNSLFPICQIAEGNLYYSGMLIREGDDYRVRRETFKEAASAPKMG